MTSRIYQLIALMGVSAIPLISNAQFTPDRLVVFQAGDGNLTLSSNGNPILFQEYSFTGTPGYSMAVPSTGTNALIIRGSANSEGHISLSEDASCIVFGAYAKALPNSSPLNSPAASTLNRGIGLIFASGNYTLAALGASPFANGDIRGAAATNSVNLWACSSTAGASYYGTNSTQGNVQNTKTNLRSVHIFNHQLYISSHSGAGTPPELGIYSVGSGTPISSSQNVNVLINTGNNSQPCQFYFNAASTICYIADSRNSNQGGIQKWVYSANSWSLAYTLSTGTNGAGAQGVVATFSGNNPKVFATTSESGNNRLIAIDDIGPSSTATTIATAFTSNTIFRGLCFSPGTVPCHSPVILGVSSNSAVCSQDTLVFAPNISGNSPITYSWSGAGNIDSISAANPKITNASTGNYTLNVSNACGSASAVIHVSINPSPTLQVSNSSICIGGIATVSASGANTYTWNTGSNAGSFTINPITTSTFVVIGTSTSGCISLPITVTVSVINSLSLSSTSSTICSGSTATLQVVGANTYTWNTGTTGNILTVTPAISSTYIVTGSASGCPNTASTTATVLVNPLPVVSFTLPISEVCETETLFQFNANPSGGTFSGPGMSGNQFSPTLAGLGTHTINYSYTDSNSCSNSTSQHISVMACTGIFTEMQKSEWSAYPNPMRESLTLEPPLENESYTVRISTCYGQLCQCFNLKGKSLLLLPELPPGLYWLEMSSEKHHSCFKLLKE